MGLKIISLIKQVPVPSEMRMGADGLMDRTKAKSVINVDCSFALEQALQIKNRIPDAELIVLSMGPASFEQSLRQAVGMGFDRAVLLSDRRLGGSDTYVTGLCLAAALAKLGFRKDSQEPFIVFAGRQTSDGDTAHVPSQVAENLAVITSPMVGTFYRAPAPDADPYVESGDMVEVGQTVCIVEAMKLMNEIESEFRGRVVKILVENAQPVEFGQKLFLIEPA